jgi:hypothetical protein
MREIRLSGLEGGVAYRAIPTPIPFKAGWPFSSLPPGTEVCTLQHACSFRDREIHFGI